METLIQRAMNELMVLFSRQYVSQQEFEVMIKNCLRHYFRMAFFITPSFIPTALTHKKEK